MQAAECTERGDAYVAAAPPVAFLGKRCMLRDPYRRSELLELYPPPADGRMPANAAAASVACNSEGYHPFIMSAFDDPLVQPVLRPYSLYQRMGGDELHTLREGIHKDVIAALYPLICVSLGEQGLDSSFVANADAVLVARYARTCTHHGNTCVT